MPFLPLIRHLWCQHQTRLAIRRQIKALWTLDDRLLSDIGLDRSDLDELMQSGLWPAPALPLRGRRAAAALA